MTFGSFDTRYSLKSNANVVRSAKFRQFLTNLATGTTTQVDSDLIKSRRTDLVLCHCSDQQRANKLFGLFNKPCRKCAATESFKKAIKLFPTNEQIA